MRYRPSQWLNEKTFKGVYGIQARTSGPWRHLAENGQPLFFDTQELRDAKLDSLRKADRAQRMKGRNQ